MRTVRSFVIAIGTLLNCSQLVFTGHYWGTINSILMSTTVIGFLMLGDLLFFDHSWKNFKILNANGFSVSYVLLCIITIYLMAVPGTLLMTDIFIGNDARLVAIVDILLIVKIIFLLVLSEIGFSVGHIVLHSYLPTLHRMHHCCIHASYFTNYIFHPLDFMIEFGTPVLMMLLTNAIAIKDDFATLCALSILITWYAMDHDVFLNLKHSSHHRLISRYFNAYLNLKGDFVQDNVRKIVKKVKSSVH